MPVLNDFLTCFCFCWRVIWCRSWWITCFFPRSFRNNITKLYLYCGFIYLLLGLWSLKFNNYEALVRLSDLSCIVSCIICCWQFELRIKEISFLLNKIMWKIWEMRFWIFHKQEMEALDVFLHFVYDWHVLVVTDKKTLHFFCSDSYPDEKSRVLLPFCEQGSRKLQEN